MSFKRRTPWTRQPQYPVGIDRSNPLTLGLKGAFSVVGTSVLYDSVNKALPITDNGLYKPTPQGVFRDFSGSAGQTATFPNRADYRLTGAMTIIVIADVDTLTNYGGLVACADTPTTNGWELRLGRAVTSSAIMFHRSNAGGFRQFTASNVDLIATGSKNNFIAVSYADELIETAPAFFNVNGSRYTPVTSIDGTGTGAQTGSVDPLYIATREDNVTRLDGAIGLVLLFDRSLSFSETESIRKNPWQLFQPLPRRLYVESAGGDATVSLAGISGEFVLTGSPASFDIRSIAQASNYSITGTATSFDLRSSAQTGAYSITGTAAKFDVSVQALSEGYAQFGIDAALNLAESVSSGAYALTGYGASFDARLNAELGGYTLTGSDTTFDATTNIILLAQPGNYSIAGAAAYLQRSDYVSEFGEIIAANNRIRILSANSRT